MPSRDQGGPPGSPPQPGAPDPERLFEEHGRRLYNYFLKMTAHRQLSEDLTQDVFLRIARYGGTYRGESSFVTWMFRIARNVLSDHRRARVEPGLDEVTFAEPIATGATPSDRLEDLRRVEALRRALSRLPLDRRQALILSRFEGLRYERIGEILECSVNAVKIKIHRALRQLRKETAGGIDEVAS